MGVDSDSKVEVNEVEMQKKSKVYDFLPRTKYNLLELSLEQKFYIRIDHFFSIDILIINFYKTYSLALGL